MGIGASPILCQLSFDTAVATVKYMIMSVTTSDRILYFLFGTNLVFLALKLLYVIVNIITGWLNYNKQLLLFDSKMFKCVLIIIQ